MHIFSAYIRYKTSIPRATVVRCGFDSRSIRGAGSQRSKFGDRRQSFDLKSPSVRLKVSSGLPREMTVRPRVWGVLSLEPNVPSASIYTSTAVISVLRKAARVLCSSTPVQAEVAGRSAGIDCRRGFDPIDRSISVDSRAVFSSLIHIVTQVCLVHARRRICNAVNIDHFADITSQDDGALLAVSRFEEHSPQYMLCMALAALSILYGWEETKNRQKEKAVSNSSNASCATAESTVLR